MSSLRYDRSRLLRYSTSERTVVGAVLDGRAVCAQWPSFVSTMWALETRRRGDGHPVAGVALGPLPGDEGHAAGFEFRFPEATAHQRGLEPLERIEGGVQRRESASNWRRAAANAPALPEVPCPDWALTEATVGLFGERGAKGDVIRVEDGERFLLCHHGADGWRCFPSLRAPRLDQVEPDVPPQDRRLPDRPVPELVDVQLACQGKGGDCTLFLEWHWRRQRIAHTYGWEGGFVSLHRVEGGAVRDLGRLRTFLRVMDNDHRVYRDERAAELIDPTLLELKHKPPPANQWPDHVMKPPPAGSPFTIAPAGRYQLRTADVIGPRGPGNSPIEHPAVDSSPAPGDARQTLRGGGGGQ